MKPLDVWAVEFVSLDAGLSIEYSVIIGSGVVLLLM